MPIYAYKCESCGFAKDVLQKLSDPVLTDCPACGRPDFSKQLTAAGFQLKGSGWYATDFKGGPAVAAPVAASTTDAPAATPDSPPPVAKPDSSASACASGCACHA